MDQIDTTRLIVPDFAKDTRIIMPLTRNIALEGVYENREGQVFRADKHKISLVNSFTIKAAFIDEHPMRFVYSPLDDFTWWRLDGKICGLADLIKQIAENSLECV